MGRSWATSVDIGDCWHWTGAVHSRGYGHRGGRLAHRIVWEELVGPIPEGLVIDHLCKNKLCVNPDHLRVVTQQENVAAGSHPLKRYCRSGHDLEVHGRVYGSSGFNRVTCTVCAAAKQRARRAAA